MLRVFLTGGDTEGERSSIFLRGGHFVPADRRHDDYRLSLRHPERHHRWRHHRHRAAHPVRQCAQLLPRGPSLHQQGETLATWSFDFLRGESFYGFTYFFFTELDRLIAGLGASSHYVIITVFLLPV